MTSFVADVLTTAGNVHIMVYVYLNRFVKLQRDYHKSERQDLNLF